MSEKVDQAQLMRFLEIEKEINGLEGLNVLKNYEVRKKAADDVAETVKSVQVTLQTLTLATKKEKADVDNLLRGSIKQMFDEADYKKKITKEQEEYLEAKNKEEVARQQLADLENQKKELEEKADEIKEPAEKLKKLYEERDTLLSDIFGGEYGSDKENMLEAQYDSLMDKKQRVSVAKYKWTNARVLLETAVNQMAHAVQKWKELGKIPPSETHLKYVVGTEARNNNIAAIQNVRSCTYYLGDKIVFPYCKEEEMQTLEKATNNIYIDMQDKKRHQHALQCYDITMRRASALLQWFDNVIKETILKDLEAVTKEAREVEKNLRAERIKLIREKIAESGGDVSQINVAGLKGMTDGFSHVDQTKLSEEDMDMKGVGITRAAPVDDEHNIPDAQSREPAPPAPTPLPLSELAPMPSQKDLFGDISEIKERYKKDTEEYMKTQELNKARMEQGLQAKLAARRHRKQ